MNILLIQLKRIGDLVLTTPAIAALRQRFPEANLTLVISQECAPLVPAIAHVDQTLVVRRGPADLGTLFSVARQRFDYCIDFTRNDRSALLAFLSNASKRIVSYRAKLRSKLRARAYNEFVQHRLRDMHTVDYNLALLEPLGIHEAPSQVRLELPDAARKEADLVRGRARVAHPFVIFHPGSARSEKFWQADRWADVIQHAGKNRSMDVVITGGTSRIEQDHLARIKANLPRPAEDAGWSVVDLSGKIDLLTLTALIAQARLLVTVDSAPMHLAAAMATPQVALFGPTNPFHWHPRQDWALILQGESPTPLRGFDSRQAPLAMKLISTQAVIDAMNSLLSAPAAHPL